METQKKRIYLYLWLLCLLGSWSVLPYISYLLPSTQPLSKAFVNITIQSVLLFGVACWLASKIVPKTDLQPFAPRSLTQILIYALPSGFLLGLAIVLFDKAIFDGSVLSGMHPPAWTGLLASLYGGINEEVLLRLFLFSLIYLILSRCFQKINPRRLWLLWPVNIITALLFGLGHLPALFQLVPPSAFEIFRVLLINGIAGVVFGWLYWSRGLWTAMAAHFTTDLMIHVFFF